MTTTRAWHLMSRPNGLPTMNDFALKEVALGLLIGFAASTVFWTAESVGALIDAQTGFNNVQMTNPLSGEQSTPISHLLSQLVIAVERQLVAGKLADRAKDRPVLARLARSEDSALGPLHAALGVDVGAVLFGIGRAREH